MSRRHSVVRRIATRVRTGARRRVREAGDDGFTLIELVVVLVIIPLIAGAIAMVLIVTLSDQASVSARVSDSVDSQITSAFYVRDVQSAQYVTTSVPASTPWPSAAGPAACTSGTPASLVVSFGWATGTSLPTGAPVEAVVSYWRNQVAGGTGSVSGRTLTSSTPVFTAGEVGQSVVDAHGTAIPFGTAIGSFVSPTQVTLTKTTTAGPVTFEVGPTLVRKYCKGGASPSKVTTSRDFFTPFLRAVASCIPTSSTCAQVTTHWIPAEVVTTVGLAVMEPDGRYDYNVSAAPRVSSAAGNVVGVPPGGGELTAKLPTLLLLGGSTRVIKEDASTAHIDVKGTTALNTGYFQQTNGTFTTTTLESSDHPITQICTGPHAKCVSITPPRATWIPITTPLPDPLAGMADPPAATQRTCPAGGGGTKSFTLSPGLYTCKIDIGGSGHVLTLQKGAYEFADGVTVNGGATLTGTSGVFIYLPCNRVDAWDPVAKCTETFTVKQSHLDVKALRTGPYAGIWYWQNKGDAAKVTISGPGTFSTTGIMYAPAAQVKLTGGGGTSTIGAIVAFVLWVHNGTFFIQGAP